MPSRKITTGAIACLIIIGIFWWFSRPVSVITATAEYGSAALYVYASGQVIPDEKATLRSKNIARIVRILVKEGDHVTQGTPLVEMYSEDVKAEVAAAAANMESARSEYEFRQIEFSRLQKLYSQEAVSHREFDQAATTLMQAEGQFKQARFLMQASANRTGEFVINSPFDGVVLERDIDPGSLVTTLDTIMVLGNKAALIVEGKVDELDAGKVQMGQKVLMSFDGLSGQVLEGTVIFVAPKVDYSTKSFKIKIALSAPASIRAGMSAELNILVIEKPQALLIPLKALQENKVWVVDGDGRTRPREVTTGLRDAQKVEITQGLVKGDIVVVSPLNLKEGDHVKI